MPRPAGPGPACKARCSSARLQESWSWAAEPGGSARAERPLDHDCDSAPPGGRAAPAARSPLGALGAARTPLLQRRHGARRRGIKTPGGKVGDWVHMGEGGRGEAGDQSRSRTRSRRALGSPGLSFDVIVVSVILDCVDTQHKKPLVHNTKGRTPGSPGLTVPPILDGEGPQGVPPPRRRPSRIRAGGSWVGGREGRGWVGGAGEAPACCISGSGAILRAVPESPAPAPATARGESPRRVRSDSSRRPSGARTETASVPRWAPWAVVLSYEAATHLRGVGVNVECEI